MQKSLLFVLLYLSATPAYSQTNVVNGSLFTLTNTPTALNGAWSWYEDERAIIDDSDPANTLLLLSTISAGGGAENGDVDLLWRNLDTGAQGEFELHNQLQQDDHDTAALYIRPDGRYLAMYAEHGSDPYTRWRISTNPNDPTAWGPEQTLNNGAGTTYNNTYFLPDDNGGAGRLYNFTRTVNYDPNVQVSYDNGTTWSAAGKLLTEGGGGDRPYLKYASDGQKIHFIATDRHPRNFQNSIYHGYVQDGVLYNTNGTVIDPTVFDANGVAPSALTSVFQNGSQFNGTTMNRAWTISLELDNTHNPVGIFTARANDNNQDHRFFYARFDGLDWQVNEMAPAGGYLYGAEDDYTGLVSIDPSNPNVVYMSSDIDPRTNTGTNKYELYKGVTSDFGQSWTWTPITENSTADNLRPVAPQWNGQNTAVTWMRGDYFSYTNWNTEIVGIHFTATDPKSLLWRGDAANPNAWDVNNHDNWDSGGGVSDVYLDGAEVAFDDTANSFNVNLTEPVAPMGIAFNNTSQAYTITGAGIGGNGGLRVIGGGNATLANNPNTYTGNTLIANGTLALAGGATIKNSPHINVAENGTLDVTGVTGGSYTLNNQALTVDGDVQGNIQANAGSTVQLNSNNSFNGNLAANDSRVQGAGTITGNLTAENNATVRVGEAGMPSQTTFTYLDATHGPAGNTTGADDSVFTPTTNPDWQIRSPYGNGDVIYQGGSDTPNPNEAKVLKTAITGLTPGKAYNVYVNYWTATGSDWRILAGPAENNLSLFDATYTNVLGATDGIDPDTLPYDVYPLTAESNRVLWAGDLGELIADANGQIAVYIDDTGTTDGDDRTWYDGLSYGAIEYEAQTLTVGNDLVLHTGATLELDVFDPNTADKVSVGNHLAAGGTLSVILDPDAPTPQLGDTFDLLDFTTADGAFDNLNLPALVPGLFWDTTDLLINGEIQVVDSLALEGDLDGDGFVGIADLNLVLGNWNALVPDNHPSDPTGDNYVGIADLNVVLGNWNAGTPPPEDAANTSIPEPAAALFLLTTAGPALIHRRHVK